MTPRRFIALLSGTPLGSLGTLRFFSYEPYYATLAAVSGIEEAHIRALDTVTAPRGSILSCCPEWLATDEVPFIRASWQTRETFVCPIHRALISTACHVCGQLRVLAPFKTGSTFTPQTFRYCLHPKCHCRVEESSSGHLPEDHPALWLQHELQHPDPFGLAFIRDGRGLQRTLLSWLFFSRTEFSTYGWPLPFESGQDLVPHWRGAFSWDTGSALTLAQLLHHPAVEDDLILTHVMKQIGWKIASLLREVGKRKQEEHFQRYHHSVTRLGAVGAFFLAWSEVPVLTTDAVAKADLERALRPFLNENGTTSDNLKVFQVCEHGRRHLLYRLNAG